MNFRQLASFGKRQEYFAVDSLKKESELRLVIGKFRNDLQF